ncbi:MAG: hypothetical protein K5659_01500 [Lachnospiraceae bacterium]|nr:hypothetical protein [Lachnospiraceae bacterium]
MTGSRSNEAGGSYTFGQKIVNNDNLKALLSLSDDEINQGTKVWLDVTDLGSNVSDEDKTLIDGAKGDYTVGLYLDINLYKKVGNNDAVKVTETNGKVKVSVVIPENLRQDGRTFEIIRVHDGKASVINGTYDASTGVYTFETELFSTYVLAYKDKVAEQPASNTSTSTDTSSAAPAATTTSDGLPKTGDHGNMLIWLCMLLASMGVLGVTGYRLYKR